MHMHIYPNLSLARCEIEGKGSFGRKLQGRVNYRAVISDQPKSYSK